MAKRIKKHIERSIPYLMIISLIIGPTVFGLVFNYNLDFYRTGSDDFSLGLSQPEARADYATTTVTVLNAAPVITVGPAESPTSTSTTPRNVGASISFTATANDPEDDNYYLIVCSSASVTANNGAAPTCDDTQFCVSGLTGDNTPTSCQYNSIADPGAETEDWYAYACDAHATEAICSPVAQGSGDSGSPFYVNHRPTISNVTTTIDNQDPGGTFEFRVVSTDSDVMGGADDLTLDICSTNSWSTTTGCTATTLCSTTSSITATYATTTCQWTDTAPTPDQAYDYYAFVKDWHEFGASNNSQTSTYTINNVAPAVDDIILNSGNDIEPNIKNGTEVTASTTAASVTDQNGCTDIVGATSTIYWSGVAGGYNCAADDNDCYKIASVSCTASGCSGATDAIMTYTCETTIAFHAYPTDANSTSTATYWLGSISVVDDNGAFGASTSPSGVDVATNMALDVTENDIDYGSITAGQNTGAVNATTTVVNYGNSPLDTDLQGADMVDSPYNIPVTQQEWSLSGFTWGTGTDLASTSAATADTVAPRPTNQTDVEDEIYWGIGIPLTQHSGDYVGSTTFTAVIDPGGNWN